MGRNVFTYAKEVGGNSVDQDPSLSGNIMGGGAGSYNITWGDGYKISKFGQIARHCLLCEGSRPRPAAGVVPVLRAAGRFVAKLRPNVAEFTAAPHSIRHSCRLRPLPLARSFFVRPLGKESIPVGLKQRRVARRSTVVNDLVAHSPFLNYEEDSLAFIGKCRQAAWQSGQQKERTKPEIKENCNK